MELVKLTNEEMIKLILEEDMNDKVEQNEMIHLLLAKAVSKNINQRAKEPTFGDKLADKMALVAGSWTFIVIFGCVLISWIVINIIFLKNPYDPYPFILLNLVLSCIAAIQAPIIMMSQNRQEEKDRLRAENDYRVNLKSEIFIEDLHEKLDRLIQNQEKILARIELKDKKCTEKCTE